MRKSHHIIFISAIFIFINVQHLSASLNKRSHEEISDCIPDDDDNKKRKLPFEYNLAYQFETGQGVEQNSVKATKLYRGLVEDDHQDAIYRLANMYYIGQGVEQDSVKAVNLYRDAAKDGHQDAMYRLAHMYEKGRGIAQDLDMAIHLYTKATRSGHKLAEHTLNKILGEFSFRDRIELAKHYKNLANQGNENAREIFFNSFKLFLNKSQSSDDNLDEYLKDQMCTLQENVSIFLGLHDMAKGDNDPTSKFKTTSGNNLLFPLYANAVDFEQNCFDILNELTKDNLQYECGFLINCLQPINQMRILLKGVTANNDIKLYTIDGSDYLCFGSSNIKIANQLMALINAEGHHRLQSVNKLKDHYVNKLNSSIDEQKLQLEEKIREFDAVLNLPSQVKELFVQMTYYRNKIFLENDHFLKGDKYIESDFIEDLLENRRKNQRDEF